MEKSITSILLIDDNINHAFLIEYTLRENFPGIDVHSISSDVDCLGFVKEKNYSIILLECNLKFANSGDLLEAMQKTGCDTPVILIGECGSEEIAVEAMKKGAYDYIVKTEKFTATLPVIMYRARKRYIEQKEKKYLELQLKNSEKRYRTLIESMHDGVCMVNRDFQVVFANSSLLNQLAREEYEVLGKRCHEVLHKYPKPCKGIDHLCPAKHIFETGETASTTHIHFSKTGEKLLLEINAHPIRNESGEITHIVEVLRDITEKKKMEEKMLQQEKLSVLIEMAGATAHELNQPLSVILPRMELLLGKLDRNEPAYSEICKINKECIRIADLVKKISTITSYKTKPYVGDVSIIDIDRASRQRYSKEEVQATPASLINSLQTVINQYSVIITDISGTITYLNKCSEDILGYTAQELVNKKDVLFFSKREPAAVRKDIIEARAPAIKKGYSKRNKTIVTKNGREIDIELCFAPLRDRHTNITGFIGIAEHKKN